jgi:DNA polymerase-3 subunit alpha/error-prone DNA polymerase
MAAVISNQGGYYSAGAYISECCRMGLFLEGPDINSSRWKYYAENPHPCGFSAWTNTAYSSAKAVETAASMPPKATKINNDRKLFRGRVVIGLMAIKGLSASGAERIIVEREAGPYKSLEDFSQRVRPGRDDIIALCPAGVFDSIAGNIPRAIQARKLLSMINRNEPLGINNYERGNRNEELFSINNDKKIPNSSFLIPHFSSPNSKLLIPNLFEEYRSLGFLRRIHPLALWKDKIIPLKRVKARHIAEYLGQNVQMLGWPVTKKEVWTKDNLSMSFLTLEDETDIYETVIFPQVYQQYGKLLFDQIPLLVRGKVCNDHGAVVVEVKTISDLTTD